MKLRSLRRRRAADLTLRTLASLSAAGGLLFLGWILLVVVRRGLSALNLDFFTQLPPPPGGEGGGLGNALLGTLAMTVVSAALGVPLGILAGVYLSEYGRESRFGAAVRFTVNVMMGIPSIIVGLFIYALVVVPMRRFSGWAGSLSLALLVLPIVARTAEDMLALVPNALRESALALGVPRWRVTLGIVLRAARTGMITGVLLAVARISGETAPLLFTALNSPYWPTSLGQPTANLTVTIFNYAMSPYANWQSAAWAASLSITAAVLVLTVLARFLSRERA